MQQHALINGIYQRVTTIPHRCSAVGIDRSCNLSNRFNDIAKSFGVNSFLQNQTMTVSQLDWKNEPSLGDRLIALIFPLGEYTYSVMRMQAFMMFNANPKIVPARIVF